MQAFKELNLPLDGLINNASVMLEERVLTQVLKNTTFLMD